MTRCIRWITMIGLAVILGWPFTLSAVEPSDALLARLQYKGMANDFAGVFATNELAELEAFLNDVKEKTTAEIAVVTLQTLDGGEVNDFANRLVERWGIGKKDKDNGILLLAVIQDRKIKIEVGYGLEGILTDAKVGRILDEQVMPSFREDKYGRGLANGARAMAEVIAQDAGIQLTNTMASASSATTEEAQPASLGDVLAALIFIGLFVTIMIVFAKKGKLSGGSGGSGSSRSGSSSRSSSSSSTFGGGRSGGGGASRSW
jgi:uncharacterized protein